ncbi:MAG: type II toxin-antitoxin system VapC family toxin [Candidatus Methanoperedens sp.]|nr:type II toxin-antitoxin system VapC family toxin [Candidatus Methanoperedens sp.]MCZ7360018.1 type II toxin-antitoxin system VapC family toxin [Candidatus Methanoperedens sp.]HLB70216.1 type II toxin-antitoxin system VapC family toxin [Candidatus Methanoperedens sp.]
MTKIYIDTNIFFNVWNEEIDPKSGKALWKGSKELLKKTEKKEFEAITSITTIMEIVHIFRVRGKDYNEAIDDIKKLNIKINVPDSWVMIKALEYQMEYELDPYDSIAFAIADTAECEIFVTRDGKIIKNIKTKMRGAEPEDIQD